MRDHAPGDNSTLTEVLPWAGLGARAGNELRTTVRNDFRMRGCSTSDLLVAKRNHCPDGQNRGYDAGEQLDKISQLRIQALVSWLDN